MADPVVIEVDTPFGGLTVLRQSSQYEVLVDGVVKHPGCTAEDVIRALGHYLHSASTQAGKQNALRVS